MTLKLNSNSGGSVSLNAPSTASDYTLTFPTQTGTVATTGDVKVIDVQSFDSSGTWNKPSGYAAGSRVLVQAWGAGGSGGRHSTAGSVGGGGGGGYNEVWLSLSQFSATETITIGAGGASRTGSNQTGAQGGDTTVGSLLTAYGGGGGGQGGAGGGGGGQLSAGSNGAAALAKPGLPFIVAEFDSDAFRQGTGNYYGTKQYPSSDLSAFWHGGGGGAGGSTNTIYSSGAASVRGGGGGGGNTTGSGGTSSFGGNGGASGATGTAGSQPGGGGGGGTSTSGAGGAGRVIITVFPA
jgi:hypothetical protein